MELANRDLPIPACIATVWTCKIKELVIEITAPRLIRGGVHIALGVVVCAAVGHFVVINAAISETGSSCAWNVRFCDVYL